MSALSLLLLPERFAVCRLDAAAALPGWAWRGRLVSITRTPEELSVVCPEANVPPGERFEAGFRSFRLEAPLAFSLVGVLVSLLAPLAAAGISVFAVSTYDTDYVLVREGDLAGATRALSSAGHRVSG